MSLDARTATLDLAALEEQLLRAHERGDNAQLVTLYARAAETAESRDAACFFLTHAYVFSLEQGHPLASTLHKKLKAFGRDA